MTYDLFLFCLKNKTKLDETVITLECGIWAMINDLVGLCSLMLGSEVNYLLFPLRRTLCSAISEQQGNKT